MVSGYTPEQVFTGRYHEIAKLKQQVLDERYELTPERFVRGRSAVPMPPKSVAINPVTQTDEAIEVSDRVNFPTLSAAGHAR